MKFVKKIDDMGKAYIYMDLEGLTIPGLPPELDIAPLLEFHIDTYKVLKASESPIAWERVFGTTHGLLKTFTDDEKAKFASMIVLMHWMIVDSLGMIDEIDGATLSDLEDNLAMLLAKFDSEVNLAERLIEYVEENIPIQSFAGVGERAQDSQEMTWYRPDVVKLTALTLLCKLMTPIFGLLIETCKKRIDTALKEIHCVVILKDIIANKFSDLNHKFMYFITNIVKPSISNKVGLTHVYNGYTFNMIVQHICAQMIARRFIAVDLFAPGGNLVTYMTSCARAAVSSQFVSSGFKTAVNEILHPSEFASEEDGNVSNLETESRSSSRTADYVLEVEAAVVQTRKVFVTNHELDREEIEAAEDFYAINHIALTPLNDFLVGIIFGPYLCGAKTVELLNMKDLASLIAMMQAYLIQQGFIDLAHAVSARPSGQLKPILTGSDTQLRSCWNNSVEYKQCADKYPFVVDKITCDTALKKIIENITTEVMTYNTAPVYWEALDQKIANGDTFVVPETLARSICTLILQLFP